jgi:tetratricopeptide (TPR) repeat protein
VLSHVLEVAHSLGNLDWLADVVKRFREALELFQHLGEPATQAVFQHQLGMVFQRANQWEQAAHHYRESTRLKEQHGDLTGAAQTWNNLATVTQAAEKPEAAETWYRRAIQGGRQVGDLVPTSRAISNLANLLQTQPGRLAEARQLASSPANETQRPSARRWTWKIP